MSSGSEETAPTSLLNVPTEVILEYILPELAVNDLARLARVNKLFHDLTSDETVWLHRTQRDFSFSPTLLAPPPAPFFKKLYLGMSSPQPYVWGSSDRSRLGNAQDPRYGLAVRSRRSYIDTPARLDITDGGLTWGENLQMDLVDAIQCTSGSESEKAKKKPVEGGRRRVAVVEMVAGGWSFAARDQDGAVYVWGQLDGGRFGYGAHGWHDKYCQVPEPTRIPLACKAESISSGRSHLLVLDSDNLIWELTSWGRAYHHTAPSLTSPTNRGASSRPHHIIQISAGWSHSTCLTSSGDVYIWYPFSDEYISARTSEEELNGPLTNPTSSPSSGSGSDDSSTSNRELKWGKINGSVVRQMEAIPERPELDVGESMQERKKAKDQEWANWGSNPTSKTIEERKKVVKIACGENFVLALRASGEVWACSVMQQTPGPWIYLPWFSGPDIKHITAQFQWITSYPAPNPSTKSHGSGQINHARLTDFTSTSNGATFEPTPLPSLAEKTIIQVALGDHHHAALTSQGEVYTWGEGSNGQLGLGDGRHTVPEPRKVIFAGDDPENQSFVFGITAGGWHTGALVLGSRASDKSREEVRVKDEKSKEKDREDENEERGGTRGIQDEVQAGTDGDGMGRIALGSPHFRIGFAGRGAMSGMGRAAPTPGLRGLRWNRGGQGNNGAGPSEN